MRRSARALLAWRAAVCDSPAQLQPQLQPAAVLLPAATGSLPRPVDLPSGWGSLGVARTAIRCCPHFDPTATAPVLQEDDAAQHAARQRSGRLPSQSEAITACGTGPYKRPLHSSVTSYWRHGLQEQQQQGGKGGGGAGGPQPRGPAVVGQVPGAALPPPHVTSSVSPGLEHMWQACWAGGPMWLRCFNTTSSGSASSGRYGSGRSSSGRSSSGSGGGRGRGPAPPDLRSFPDLPSLAAAAEAGAAEWNAGKLCAAFNEACKHGMAPGQPPRDDDPQRAALLHCTLATLAAHYLPLVPGLRDAKSCVIPLWACAKAGYWGAGLAAALLQRLGRDGGMLMRKANGQDHANLWWSLSRAPGEVLEAGHAEGVLRTSADCRLLWMAAADIKAQHFSNILLACARLRHNPGPLLHDLTAGLVARPDAECQHLANGLYALGELCEDCGHKPLPQDLRRLAAGVEQRLHGAGSSGQQDSGGGFIPQALSNMLLGCSKLGHSDPTLLRPLAAVAGQAARRMNGQDLANSLYALGVLECRHPAYAAAVEQLAAECMRRQFVGFKAQELSNSAWGLAKLGHRDQSWFAAAVVAAVRPDTTRALNTQDWSNMWYALALVRHRPAAALMEGTLAASQVLRTQANGQECANLLWSLATLGVPYESRLVDVLVGRLVELLPRRGGVNEQDLAISLWALAVMGPAALSGLRGFVEQLLREVVRRWAASGAAAITSDSSSAGPFSREQLAQLWQVQQELPHAEGCAALTGILAAAGGGVSSRGSLLSAMRHAAKEERGVEADASTSRLQEQVAAALGRLQRQRCSPIVSVSEEQEVEGLLGRVDVVVELAGGRRVAVEVDGPWHFMANNPHTRTRDGPTQLRDRQLGRAFGAGNVVSMQYWEWDGLRGDERREEGYLLHLLGLEAGGT